MAVPADQSTIDWLDVAVRTGSVIFGVLIGGLISYLLARRTSKEVLRRDAEAREYATKHALAKALVVFQRLSSEISRLRNYMFSRLELFNASENPLKEPWWFVFAITGLNARDVPEFESDSLAAILLIGDLELMLELTKFQRHCLASHSSFADYSSRRLALEDRMPPPKVVEGQLVQEFSDDERALLYPYTDALNQMIAGLDSQLERDWELAASLTEPFLKLLRVHLNEPNLQADIETPSAPQPPGPPTEPGVHHVTLDEIKSWGPRP